MNYFNSISSIDRYVPEPLIAQYPEFTELFKTYIQFLNSNSRTDVLSRVDLSLIDDKFISNIKNEIASDIPLSSPIRTLSKSETINVLQTAINLYKSKGTLHSIKYLFRVLYGTETDIDMGRLGDYLEYKPTSLEIVEIDSSGNVVSPNYDKLSNNKFYKIGSTNLVLPYEITPIESAYAGFCVTYFDGVGDHLWTELSADISAGDVLMFPDTGRYVVVLSKTNLELDGWAGKTERWRDTNNFYVIDEINYRIFGTFYDELFGFNIITPIDSSGVRYTYTNGLLSFRELAGLTEPISITLNTVESYSVLVYVQVTDGVITYMSLNSGVNIIATYDEMNKSWGGIVVDASHFKDINDNYAATPSYLDQAKKIISEFSIYFINDVDPSIYMDTIRRTVVPAGYKTIHVSSKATNVDYWNTFYVDEQATIKQKYKAIVDMNSMSLVQLLSKVDNIDSVLYYHNMTPIVDHLNFIVDYDTLANANKTFYLTMANTVDYNAAVYYNGTYSYNGTVKYSSTVHKTT